MGHTSGEESLSSVSKRIRNTSEPNSSKKVILPNLCLPDAVHDANHPIVPTIDPEHTTEYRGIRHREGRCLLDDHRAAGKVEDPHESRHLSYYLNSSRAPGNVRGPAYSHFPRETRCADSHFG